MVSQSSPVLILPLSALIIPRPDNAFPNILAANVLHNIGRNLFFFYSFLVVSLIPFIINLDSSSDLTIFIISSIY